MHVLHRPGRPRGVDHNNKGEENEFQFHSVTRYTNSTVSLIHVHNAKLRNITCTLVAANVIPRSLECTTFIVKAQNLSAAEARLPRRLHPYPGFIFTLFSRVREYPVNNNSRESSWGWVFAKIGPLFVLYRTSTV